MAEEDRLDDPEARNQLVKEGVLSDKDSAFLEGFYQEEEEEEEDDDSDYEAAFDED